MSRLNNRLRILRRACVRKLITAKVKLRLPLIVIYEAEFISWMSWSTLKRSPTLATGRRAVMHSHLWQILCKMN